MKSHRYIQSRLLLMLEHALSPQEQQQVQRHLAQCPECRALLSRMEKVYRENTVEAVPRISPFVWTRLQARLQQPAPPSLFRFGLALLKPAIVVVLLFLSLLTGHYLGSVDQAALAPISDEELVYRTFGMDATEPFAGHTLAGAVQAVYDQP